MKIALPLDTGNIRRLQALTALKGALLELVDGGAAHLHVVFEGAVDAFLLPLLLLVLDLLEEPVGEERADDLQQLSGLGWHLP